MAEIVLVTAFFDIGRGTSPIMPRTTEKYFKDFEFWARMKNELVVYTAPYFQQKIMAVREKFGLGGKTKIYTISDIYDIEPEIFKRMQKIEDNGSFVRWRRRIDSSDNIAKYNYLTFLKFWFMKEAGSIYGDKLISWIDFGYNHGGEVYCNSKEFDFKWDYDFREKINIFAFKKTWREDFFGGALLQSMVALVSASIMVAPSCLCEKYFTLCKNALNALLMLDCMDDDQMLMLMAYRECKDLFQIRLHEKWHTVLKEYGGEHLTLTTKTICRKTMLDKCLSWLKGKKKILYLKNFLLRKFIECGSDDIFVVRL